MKKTIELNKNKILKYTFKRVRIKFFQDERN